MRRLLAVDTTAWWGSVALVESAGPGCRLVVEAGERVPDSHAARLLPMIERALSEAGWARNSVDAFAAVRGPGSFTGIRVGLGTLRGLAMAAGRPCIGIGALESMAEDLGPCAERRAPMRDAGRGEMYAAVFDPASSPPCELIAPWLAPPARSAEIAGAGAIAFGDAAETHGEVLAAAGIRVVRGRGREGLAGAAGRIAWARLEAGAPDGDGLSPLYLRPADAEIGRRP